MRVLLLLLLLFLWHQVFFPYPWPWDLCSWLWVLNSVTVNYIVIFAMVLQVYRLER